MEMGAGIKAIGHSTVQELLTAEHAEPAEKDLMDLRAQRTPR
jgi:hypothetical protein